MDLPYRWVTQRVSFRMSPATQIGRYLGIPHAGRRQVTLISRDRTARQHYRDGGCIRLDPPGIMLDIDAIYGRAEAS